VIRHSAAVALVAALLAAPTASADPDDIEPYCTGGQEPTTGECQQLQGEVYTDDAPGADPLVPLGVDPESVPAV